MSGLQARPRHTLAAGIAVLLTAASGAQAGTFSSAELSYDNALLSQFNLVTIGDYKSTATQGNYAYTEGRALIGGNATATNGGGAAFCTGGNCLNTSTTTPVDSTRRSYGAATVFGNVAFNSTYFAAGYNTAGTNAYIGGNASGYIYAGNKTDISIAGWSTGLRVDYADNIYTKTWTGTTAYTQTGKTYTGISAASVFPFTSGGFTTEVKSLSTGLANLPGSPGVTSTPNGTSGGIFFTSANDYVIAGKKYGVITTTLSDLVKQTNLGGIVNGDREATFVIVTGYDPKVNYTLPNLNSYAGANRVIFDFVDAKALSFSGNWNGSILAPLATITSIGGTIDGTVIVNSINQSQALLANNLFTGDLLGLVPEPTSLALFGAGLAAAGLLRRRRK